jgi:outer membrane protein assembly factor BamD
VIRNSRLSLLQALRASAVAATLFALTACASDEEPVYVERTVEQLYNAATNDLIEQRYAAAARGFDEVERQHPYSVWATKAQLMSAYAYYADNKYDDAVNALDRFVKLHPTNRDAPYAYYLKALCYYEQITDVGRDQKITAQALDALNEIVRRYPTSDYARDAVLKIDLARDHLAGKEMEIGRFYQGRGQYLAAINRFRVVVDEYQTTTHVPEALHRLSESYSALGIADQATASAAVLGHNYPGSDWYSDSYGLLNGNPATRRERGWFTRLWDWVF